MINRLLKALAAVLVCVWLSSCGGGASDVGAGGIPVLGGGSSGGTATPTALFTTAANSVTLTVGSSSSAFAISGGTPGYSVTSNDTSVATISANGSNFTINSVAGGSASISIKDSVGAEVIVGVTVGSNTTSLFTSAPASLTVAVGATSQEFRISGGTPAYSVTSSNAAVATVGINNSNFVVSGVAGGKVVVTVKDAKGNAVSSDVTVGSATPLYTTAPSQLSVAVGATQAYGIGGGAAPYTIATSNGSLATASVNGSVFSIAGVAVGTANMVVRDSLGATVSVAVTIGSGPAGTALFTSAASDVVVAPGTSPTYTIGGGSGPYSVSTSDSTVALASISGSTTVKISGIAAGSAKIVVLDTAGAKVQINVVVGTGSIVALYTTAPSTLTLAPGISQAYTIGGGVGPYLATSGNASLVTVSVIGSQLTINGLALGSAQVSIFDSTGKSVTLGVTVAAAAALNTSAPSAITLAVGSGQPYSIGGGTAPYVVTSSNVAVATVAVTGSTFTASGVIPGAALLVIRDAVGATLTVNVAVVVATPLYVGAPGSVTITMASTASYPISGGVGPYSPASSDTGVVTASVTASTLTLTGVGSGSAVVVLRDSVGGSATIAVTVGTLPALYTSAPASIALTKGVAVTYVVGGGAAGYSAISSDTRVATASVSGSVLTITGAGSGTASVVLRDAAKNTLTVSVTVGSLINLFTSAPGAITLLPSGTQTYVISGGEGPYLVASSNTAFATASVLQGVLTVTGVAAGSASVVVSDALGAIVPIAVTVTPASSTPLAVTPLSATASVGDTLTFTISGGDPSYSVTANNPSIAQVGTPGATFTTKLLNAGATTIAVIDSRGQVQTVTLTVTQVQPLLRTSPTSVAVSERNTADISLDIYGGVSPYRVFTSDRNLSSVTLSDSGTSVIVGLGSNGNRCITESTIGYLGPGGNSKVYGDWSLNFGSVGVVITVVDSVGRSTNAALIIVDNGGTCP